MESRINMLEDVEVKEYVEELTKSYKNLKDVTNLYKVAYDGLHGILIYSPTDFHRIATLFEAEVKEEEAWNKHKLSAKINDVEFITFE